MEVLIVQADRVTYKVIDEENIGGAFVELLRRTEEKLKSHNRIAFDITAAPTHQIEMPCPQDSTSAHSL